MAENAHCCGGLGGRRCRRYGAALGCLYALTGRQIGYRQSRQRGTYEGWRFLRPILAMAGDHLGARSTRNHAIACGLCGRQYAGPNSCPRNRASRSGKSLSRVPPRQQCQFRMQLRLCPWFKLLCRRVLTIHAPPKSIPCLILIAHVAIRLEKRMASRLRRAELRIFSQSAKLRMIHCSCVPDHQMHRCFMRFSEAAMHRPMFLLPMGRSLDQRILRPSVRESIRELPAQSRECQSRAPIKPAAIETMIDEALRIERDAAKDLRFISLANLYNACVEQRKSWLPSGRPLPSL